MKALMLLTLALSTAQAADEVLTLACQGTTRGGSVAPDEPNSMSLIVNFTAQTVAGFRHGDMKYDIPVAITAVNDLTITFGGSRKVGSDSETLTGTIDFATGDVQATETVGSVTRAYSLKCKPTQRMFYGVTGSDNNGTSSR